MMQADDRELWERARVGDRSAFGEIFVRHARAVYNHCFRRTSDWAEAEDLTSIVFLEAWRRHRDVVPESRSALPWLLGVANHVLRNRRRSKWRYHAALRRVSVPTVVPDSTDDLAARLDDERRMREVLQEFRKLPRSDQEVLELCVWSGLSYQDAAEVLAVPVGTIRSRLSRARSRLKDLTESEPKTTSGHSTYERQPVHNGIEEEA